MKKGPMLSVEANMEVDLAAMGKSSALQFPIFAQVKFDGFRCIVPNGNAVTRALKPIKNDHVRDRLRNLFGTHNAEDFDDRDHPLNGFDGELIALDPETYAEEKLHKTQSRINSVAGFPRFVFHVFDDFSLPKTQYEVRQIILAERLKRIRNHVSAAALETNPERRSHRIHDHVFQEVETRFCERIEDVLEFEANCLAWGAEGIMLKRPDGHYKFGRSALNEGLSLKVKRFTDAEASIIGFVEKMHNDNPAETDERGFTKRSSKKENLRPAETLGALVLKWNGIEFEIGTGWDAEVAQEIWDRRDFYIGQSVNFKYKDCGPNGKPLIPSFQGIRYDV